MDLVTGRNLVPNPAAGMTAFFMVILPTYSFVDFRVFCLVESSSIDDDFSLEVEGGEFFPFGGDENRIGG
jgi:hypothetical protein